MEKWNKISLNGLWNRKGGINQDIIFLLLSFYPLSLLLLCWGPGHVKLHKILSAKWFSHFKEGRAIFVVKYKRIIPWALPGLVTFPENVAQKWIARVIFWWIWEAALVDQIPTSPKDSCPQGQYNLFYNLLYNCMPLSVWGFSELKSWNVVLHHEFAKFYGKYNQGLQSLNIELITREIFI